MYLQEVPEPLLCDPEEDPRGGDPGGPLQDRQEDRQRGLRPAQVKLKLKFKFKLKNSYSHTRRGQL